MPLPIKCIIIDDEPLARELIKSYVAQNPSLSLSGSYASAAEAIMTIKSGEIDLIFLDINMPMLNGIDFAALVPPSTRIIFVTAYENYALQGFKVNALDYLLKPVSFAEFTKAVAKAVEWVKMRDTYRQNQTGPATHITVKADYRLIQIPLDKILYIEARNDRVIFFRKDASPANEFEEVSSQMTMKEVEELLPSDRFMRVHRSFIVNIPNIEVVERQRIVFGKTYIPISETKKEEFFARFIHS